MLLCITFVWILQQTWIRPHNLKMQSCPSLFYLSKCNTVLCAYIFTSPPPPPPAHSVMRMPYNAYIIVSCTFKNKFIAFTTLTRLQTWLSVIFSPPPSTLTINRHVVFFLTSKQLKNVCFVAGVVTVCYCHLLPFTEILPSTSVSGIDQGNLITF